MNDHALMRPDLQLFERVGANRISWPDRTIIRALDILLSALLILFLAPFLILVAIAVFVGDPGPIFFAQRRIGRHGTQFPCFKFRSMVVDAEARLADLIANDPGARREWERDHKLRSDPRITRIGNFLRRSSVDELPQLFNVIRGEMSLVGPRPISASEISRYGRYFYEYVSLRPGMTGLWQISGRNNTSYRRRVALDVAFSRSYSLKLYLRIGIMTVPAVLMARGSY